MGNNPDQSVSSGKLLKDADCLKPGFLIQGTKAFVNEKSIHTNIPCRALDDIRHAKGHGKSCHKGFSAGKGFNIPYLICCHAVYIQIQAYLPLLSKSLQIPALKQELAVRHNVKPFVSRMDHLVKVLPLDIGLKVQADGACHFPVGSLKQGMVQTVFLFQMRSLLP